MRNIILMKQGFEKLEHASFGSKMRKNSYCTKPKWSAQILLKFMLIGKRTLK